MGAGRTLPLPPLALRERVGATTFPGDEAAQRQIRRAPWWDPDPAEAWLRQGEFLRGVLREHLPDDLDLKGARVLDFGCGAGRVMRHLVEDVGDGELRGVDIDRPSIEWLEANACPPLRAAACGERPGLPHPDGHFDLVYVFSVFTHIVEDWAGWLLELRRVLAPKGVLLASVIGRETGDELGLPPLDSEAPGMYATALGNPWDHGGPVVVHDPEWVAERWGRAFDILSHAARVTGDPWPHDVVVMRSRAEDVTEEDLLAPASDGDGEAWAAQLRMLRAGALGHRAHDEALARRTVEEIARRRAEVEAGASARIAELTRRHTALEQELSVSRGPGGALP